MKGLQAVLPQSQLAAKLSHTNFNYLCPRFKNPNINDTQRTGNHTQGILAGAL
jgi:hypothetical protein